MGMPASHADWTVEMVQELPDDGNRYEVIDGELLVSPAPSYPEYWIIDPQSRTVERWRPDSDHPQRVATILVWQPVPTDDALTIDLARYFRAVHDEA
jgi:Uma2 family endonuclease